MCMNRAELKLLGAAGALALTVMVGCGREEISVAELAPRQAEPELTLRISEPAPDQPEWRIVQFRRALSPADLDRLRSELGLALDRSLAGHAYLERLTAAQVIANRPSCFAPHRSHRGGRRSTSLMSGLNASASSDRFTWRWPWLSGGSTPPTACSMRRCMEMMRNCR